MPTGMRVIVVGAGIVGMSAARALVEAGHLPTVLDQGPIPNPHASSHDAHRLIRLAHSDGDGRGHTIHDAYAAWGRTWRALGRSHLVETGMLLTAREPGDWAYSCRAAFDRDRTEYEIWDHETLAQRAPMLALTDADWGLYTPQGGALLAERILHDLADWLRVRGVALRGHAHVREIGRRAVVIADERLDADAIVVATGAWTGKLLPELAASLEPRRSVVVYLKPRPDLAAGWRGSPCFLDFGGPHDIYGMPPLAGYPIKFGVGITSYPEDPDASRALRRDEPERQLAVLRPFIKDLDRYSVTTARVCWTCYSPDEKFIAGTMDGGRTAYASGCSGQMFKFGAVMGEKLAAAVTGGLDGAELTRWARGEVAPLTASAG